MRKLVLGISILLIGLLTACGEITVTTPTPDPDPVFDGSSFDSPFRLQVSDDNQSPTDIFALAGGTNFYYRIEIPGDSGGDGVWFELAPTGDGDITNIADIGVFTTDSNGEFQQRLRSLGPESFGLPTSYSNLSELETSAIVPVPVDEAVECRGPCVFVEYPANRQDDTTYYANIRVRARVGSAINYQLYTYAASYYDETENINNQCSTLGIQSINSNLVTPVDAIPDYVGAIESVNDVDCFTSNDVFQSSTRGITIELPAETTIAIRADFYNSASSTILETCIVSPSAPTCSKEIDVLELLVKVSPAEGKAASFANAKYELFFQ